jgi:sulfur carrier protein ThiS
MDESHIVDIWTLFKEYVDKKHIEMAAERYIDLLADYGIADDTLIASVGSDVILDHAISYYLDIDEDVLEEETDWDE